MTTKKIDKHLAVLAGICKDFIAQHGGMSNGYETRLDWGGSGPVEIFTPAFHKKTHAETKDLGYELARRLKDYLNENSIDGELSLSSRHLEYGCFEMKIGLTRSAVVRLS